MSNEKNYADGTFIYEKKSQYGSFFSIDITEDFVEWFNKNKIQGQNGKSKVRVNIFEKQNKEDKKPTHYMVLNNPTNTNTNNNTPKNPAISNIPTPVSDNVADDDLPF